MKRLSAGLRPALCFVAAVLAFTALGQARAAELPSDLDLVPRNAVGFYHFRAADIAKAEWLADLRHLVDQAGPEAFKMFREKFAPDPSTVERVTLVMLSPRAFGDPFPSEHPEAMSAVIIIRTNKPYDRLQVMQSLGMREKLYKRHLYYFNEDPWSGMVLLDDHTILLASEDALIEYFNQERTAKKAGPLQPALETAAGPHQFTIGLNAELIAKEAQGGVPPGLGKLLESRCITMTLDLDKEIHFTARFDYEKKEEATAGAKALRDFLDFTREQMKRGITELEKQLKEPEKEQAEKAPAKDIPLTLSALLGLGVLREIDRVFKDSPIETRDTAVTLDMTYKDARTMNMLFVGMIGIQWMVVREFRNFEFPNGIEAAQRDPEAEYLKQIAAALEKYHEEKGCYPPPAILGKDGRPLLSWRVALLPYMGDQEKDLYSKFNLEEPWDSFDNKKLIKEMPGEYRAPSRRGRYDQFRTSTFLFTGEGNVFGPKSVKKGDLKPGAALLALSHRDVGVIWTKPADLNLAEGKPLPDFWGKKGDQKLHVLFADGSVRHFARDSVEEKILREIARPAGAKPEALPKPAKPDERFKE